MMTMMMIKRIVLLFGLVVPGAYSVSHTTFCMVTASRRTSYLDKTLKSYDRERVWGSDGVGLMVVDVDNSSQKAGVYKLLNRTVAPCDGPDVDGIPSCQTRQSTLDITAALRVCARHTSGWVVLVEDDNPLCDGALDELVTTLGGLDAKAMAMAKFSPFGTGMSFPVGKVMAFVNYSVARLHTHPHDITRIEDWDTNGRLYTHPRTLFEHVGQISTHEYRNSQAFRTLYARMRHYACHQRMQ